MARPRIEIDTTEINEIIDLYIKEELNGIVSKLTNRGVCKFNEQIASNPNYKRNNGQPFNLYKYWVWGGQYNGEDGLGKIEIKKRLKRNEVRVVGENFLPDVSDIVQLVNDLHNKPIKLITRLRKIFERERKEKELFKLEKVKYKKMYEETLSKLEMQQKAITNLMFQSQSPDNSLNDMFNMSKPTDNICINELINIFNCSEERLSQLLTPLSKSSNINSIDNIIDMSSKLNSDRYKGL